MESNYYLYFLLCKNNAIYTGITNDLEKRVKKHISGSGAKYTKIFGVKEILCALKLENKSLALSVEMFVKNKDKKYKLNIIKSYDTLKKDYNKKKNKILCIRKVSCVSIKKINSIIYNI